MSLQQTARQLSRRIRITFAQGIRLIAPPLRTLTTARPGIPCTVGLGALLVMAVIVNCHYSDKQQKSISSPLNIPAKIYAEKYLTETNRQSSTTMRNAVSAADLVSQLKNEKLWDIPALSAIPPVLFSGFPENLDRLEVNLKKRTFLHTMLPVVMVALAEVKQERARLLRISTKTNLEVIDGLVADDLLSAGEISFLHNLAQKYKAKNIEELRDKVNVFPVSMILAQSAIESSWGTSRFARQGNNLFGIWTWGDSGIIPARREAGKRHKIAVYDSILDSVKAYILTLNRLPAYQELRELRKQTMEPAIMARGLRLYSEKREKYVNAVQQIIAYNKLQKYDCILLADDRETDINPGIAPHS